MVINFLLDKDDEWFDADEKLGPYDLERLAAKLRYACEADITELK